MQPRRNNVIDPPQGQYSKHPPLLPGEALDQQKAVPTGAPRRTYTANCTAKSKGIPFHF